MGIQHIDFAPLSGAATKTEIVTQSHRGEGIKNSSCRVVQNIYILFSYEF
jgi:hypothetical protein